MAKKTERSTDGKGPEKKAPEKRRSAFREYFEALIVAGIFLGFTNTFVLKTFFIPSASMEETLLIGDHLFVNRFIYGPEGPLGAVLPGRDLRRGDIVVFRSVEEQGMDLVKRCVGLPGDRLEMRDKVLYINGEVFDDSAFARHTDREIWRRNSHPYFGKRDNWGPIEVPADRYFCLGDNRDESHDSRFWGTVPENHIKGRAFVVYWSYGGETPDGSWHGWGHRLRQLAGTAVGFITRTRWKRTLHLIR